MEQIRLKFYLVVLGYLKDWYVDDEITDDEAYKKINTILQLEEDIESELQEE